MKVITRKAIQKVKVPTAGSQAPSTQVSFKKVLNMELASGEKECTRI